MGTVIRPELRDRILKAWPRGKKGQENLRHIKRGPSHWESESQISQVGPMQAPTRKFIILDSYVPVVSSVTWAFQCNESYVLYVSFAKIVCQSEHYPVVHSGTYMLEKEPRLYPYSWRGFLKSIQPPSPPDWESPTTDTQQKGSALQLFVSQGPFHKVTWEFLFLFDRNC